MPHPLHMFYGKLAQLGKKLSFDIRVYVSFIFLFWRLCDFDIRFWSRNTLWNTWNRHWGSSIVDTGILLNNIKFDSPLTNVKWQSGGYHLQWHPPHIILYTNTWHCCRILPFTYLQEVPYRAFVTEMAS